ncbi:Protein MTH-2, partial [Aphelenchoides avenae]
RNVFASSNDGSMHPTRTILQSVERLLWYTSMDISYLAGANLGVSRRKTNCSAKTDQLKYAVGLVDNGRTFSSDLSGSKAPDAAIMVPSSTMCATTSKGTVTSVFFVIYRSSKLFVGNSTYATNAVDPPYVTESTPNENRCSVGFSMSDDKVLTAVVLDDKKTQLRQLFDAATGLPQKMVYAPLHGDLKVSWWTGNSWSKETCKVKENGALLVSECDHLTDFSLLVDGMQTDPALCSAFVSTVSYVVDVGSVLSLLVLNGLYLVNRCTKSRESKISKLLFLQGGQKADTFVVIYNGILLAFYLCFSVSVNGGRVGDATFCEVVAGVNYWLLLCCIFLTIFQAWRVLKAFAWSTNMEFVIVMVTKPYVMFGFSFGKYPQSTWTLFLRCFGCANDDCPDHRSCRAEVLRSARLLLLDPAHLCGQRRRRSPVFIGAERACMHDHRSAATVPTVLGPARPCGSRQLQDVDGGEAQIADGEDHRPLLHSMHARIAV